MKQGSLDPIDRCVVSVSGIRGLVGEGITPSMVCQLGSVIGHRLARRRPVVVGRDSRSSGALLQAALSSGLRGVGCPVIDLGVVPTPTVPLMLQQCRAAAGVQISASHNPDPWNALKIYNRQGRNIDQGELSSLLQAYRKNDPKRWLPWDRLGSQQSCDTALQCHLRAVLRAVDVSLIRQRGFTVLLDSVNGAGAGLGPLLLEALGCRVIPFYDRIDRCFPRNPEPTAANVVETGRVARALGVDIAFVQDPDADRLAVIDERGRYVGEEYTLALCAAARCAAHEGVVIVTNLSTSRMVEDVAQRYAGRVERTAVGEAHVLDAMGRTGALLGGEGNGGVIDPRVVLCRDSHIAMALILEHLARQQWSCSQAIADIPAYAMHKEKIALDRSQVRQAIDGIKASPLAQGARIEELDGLKLIWEQSWVHLRASGTEPLARIISEAPDQRQAKALAGQLRRLIAEFNKA